MKTVVIQAHDAVGLRRAAELLRSGELVAFPTDTVYGLAAYPWNGTAVRRLYRVKERPRDLPIPLLLSDAEQIGQVADLAENCTALTERFWPGSLTLVLGKAPCVLDVISDRPTVAVRVPDLELARRLIRNVGGVLAVTSANVSGEPSPTTAEDVLAQLGGRISLILDGGPCPVGVASTILDCSVEPPVILRQGAVSDEELRTVLGRLGAA